VLTWAPAANQSLLHICYKRIDSTKTTKQSSVKYYNVHGELYGASAMGSLAVLEQICGASQKRNKVSNLAKTQQ